MQELERQLREVNQVKRSLQAQCQSLRRLCHQLVQGQDPFDNETDIQLNEARDATPVGIRQLDHTVETTRCELALEPTQALPCASRRYLRNVTHDHALLNTVNTSGKVE
ncbi:hypothetical protein AC1031_001549 [Aphanomyces cochlioides]|nr:hypothetical protein AC1031_001549 [Aphanomyces cochlioides]